MPAERFNKLVWKSHDMSCSDMIMWLSCFSGLKFIPKWNWLAVFTMGNSSGHNNTMSIPPGKGPHQVGCTDLMVGHTVHVSVHLNCVYSNCLCVISRFRKCIYISSRVRSWDSTIHAKHPRILSCQTGSSAGSILTASQTLWRWTEHSVKEFLTTSLVSIFGYWALSSLKMSPNHATSSAHLSFWDVVKTLVATVVMLWTFLYVCLH